MDKCLYETFERWALQHEWLNYRSDNTDAGDELSWITPQGQEIRVQRIDGLVVDISTVNCNEQVEHSDVE